MPDRRRERLNLRHDRLDYTGGLLAPPPGCHLERAVATTYSLDLETLLAVLLPLDIGAAPPDSPETYLDGPLVLRALKRMAPRLTIFHQAGQIAVPTRRTPLHALLDRILVPVTLPSSRSPAPAFHPKTWTLEFRDGEGIPFYRFLVLSRNLTRDDSLDISLALESGHDRRQTRRTAPLLGFLSFLRRQIPSALPHANDHDRHLSKLAKGLAAHPLALAPDAPWDDFALFPMFNTASRHALAADPLFAGRPGRVVAMSPFLSSSVIRDLAGRADAPLTLFTRADAYADLEPGIRRLVGAWALKSPATDPVGFEPDAEPPRDTDLHAKLYLRESPGETALLLGSMNATDPGLHRNAEMVVRLRCPSGGYGRADLLRDLFGPAPDASSNPFEPLHADDGPTPESEAAKADGKAVQAALDSFCRCSATGRVETDGTLHTMVVDVPASFAPSPRVRRCTLRPLALSPDRACSVTGTLRFKGLTLADLSPLFVLTAKTATATVSRVVRIPLANLDEDARDAAATRSVVDASGGWAACLAVFFSVRPYHAAAEIRTPANGENGGETPVRHMISGLYEDMLRSAAEPGGAARFAELDLDALLAGQTGPEANRVRELLALFRSALPKKRSLK